MAGTRPISGRMRVAHCGIAIGSVVFGACEEAPQSNGLSPLPATGGAAAGPSQAGTGASAGTISFPSGGTFGTPLSPVPVGPPPMVAACAFSDDGSGGEAGAGDAEAGAGGETGRPIAPLFCDQMVWNSAPAHRVLYTWTTPEQLAELRRDRVLLTRTETPGLGRGYAFTSIDALAARGDAPENQLLAMLSRDLFRKVRYAWPHPWATRQGWPGEDYGDALVRVVLKPDAWIVVVHDDRGMAVIDLDNQPVPIADALAHPERIAAVFFVKTDVTGNGSFFECSGGYREFIIGNEAMIEEWSVATDEIRARLEEDIARLDRFFERVRPLTTVPGSTEFNRSVACNWDAAPFGELDTYARALAIPSAYYLPRAAEVAAIAETLRASLPAQGPLIVRPGG
jgi:hypothetical protein